MNTPLDQLKQNLSLHITSRRERALRWRTLPEGRAKRETLIEAKKRGVLVRRLVRAIRNLERGPSKRTEYFRQQKEAKRKQLALEGGVTFTFRLTREEQNFFVRCLEKQAGNPDTFLKRAILTGAAFIANSGGRKGDKPNNKIKRNEKPEIKTNPNR